MQNGSHANLALTLSCCIALAAWPALARAESPPSKAVTRSDSSLDIKLSVGGVQAAFWRRNFLVAEFDALSINLELRYGWFSNQHLLIGLEGVGGAHVVVSDLELREVTPYGVPADEVYSVVAPLGVFFELYPFSDEGAYVAASAGVGFMFLEDHPEFGPGEYFLGRYSFELGYELSGSGKRGLGCFVRYNRWGASGALNSDEPQVTSHDVAAGARWSFF